jgi:hypothetical protein
VRHPDQARVALDASLVVLRSTEAVALRAEALETLRGIAALDGLPNGLRSRARDGLGGTP